MSIIDIILLAIIVIGFIAGFFGKWQIKLISLASIIIAAITAYFTAGLLANTIGAIKAGEATILETFSNWVAGGNTEGAIGAISVKLAAMAPGLFKLSIFIAEFICLSLVLFIIRLCFIPLTRKFKANTAVKTGGIPSLIKATLITTIICLPVFVAAPMLNGAAKLLNATDKSNQTIQYFGEQVDSSFILKFTDKLLGETSFSLLTYDKNGEESNLYTDCVELGSLGDVVPVISILKAENKLKAAKQVSAEDLHKALVSIDANKDVLSDVIKLEHIEDITTIEFVAEEEPLNIILSTITLNAEGEITFEIPEGLTVETFASALADSKLCMSILVAGDLSGMPTEFVDATKVVLAELNTDKEKLSDEKYTLLLSYLEPVVITE